MNAPLRFALELLFPQNNVCLLCERGLYGKEYLLCEKCARELRKQAIPPKDRISALPGVEGCISTYDYSKGAAKLVRMLKYNSVSVAAEILGAAMAEALMDSSFFGEADALVPVPIHKARLRERGYNQAALLTRVMASHTGKPLLEQGMQRLDTGRSQVGTGREERLKRLDRRFQADPLQVEGKKLVLVDDVLTTGATAQICAHALLDGGAKKVWVLTACRA